MEINKSKTVNSGCSIQSNVVFYNNKEDTNNSPKEVMLNPPMLKVDAVLALDKFLRCSFLHSFPCAVATVMAVVVMAAVVVVVPAAAAEEAVTSVVATSSRDSSNESPLMEIPDMVSERNRFLPPSLAVEALLLLVGLMEC